MSMKNSSCPVFEFGDFHVVKEERLLRDKGTAVELHNMAFNLLLVFIDNPQRLLTKDYLMNQLWPVTVVEENNLAQHVSELRKVLRDKEKELIKTVPGQGYKFMAEVREVELPPPFWWQQFVVWRKAVSYPVQMVLVLPMLVKTVLAALAIAACFFVFWWIKLRPVKQPVAYESCGLTITEPQGQVYGDTGWVRVSQTQQATGFLWIFTRKAGSAYGWWPQKTSLVKDGWEADARFGDIGEKGNIEIAAVLVDSQTNRQIEDWFVQDPTHTHWPDLPSAVNGCRLIVTITKP